MTFRISYVFNDMYLDTNTAYSLMLAATAVGGSEFIKFDPDVVFDVKILRLFMESDLPNLLCIDRNIALEDDDGKVLADDQMRALEVGKSVDRKAAIGESIGIEKISARTGSLLFSEMAKRMKIPVHHQECYEAAYAQLMTAGTVFQALDVSG